MLNLLKIDLNQTIREISTVSKIIKSQGA